jgi:hypothetical protein
VRLAASLSVLITLTIAPFLLAGDHGWSGQRPFPVELGSTLGISALAVFAIVVILPTRIRAFARLGADAAVRLHRHLVEVLLALSYTTSAEDPTTVGFTVRSYVT